MLALLREMRTVEVRPVFGVVVCATNIFVHSAHPFIKDSRGKFQVRSLLGDHQGRTRGFVNWSDFSGDDLIAPFVRACSINRKMFRLDELVRNLRLLAFTQTCLFGTLRLVPREKSRRAAVLDEMQSSARCGE